MSESKKQADKLEAGDRISFEIRGSYEIIKADADEESVLLEVIPVGCGASCNGSCACERILPLDDGKAMRIRVPKSRRPVFLGNPVTLRAQIERDQKLLAAMEENQTEPQAQGGLSDG